MSVLPWLVYPGSQLDLVVLNPEQRQPEHDACGLGVHLAGRFRTQPLCSRDRGWSVGCGQQVRERDVVASQRIVLQDNMIRRARRSHHRQCSTPVRGYQLHRLIPFGIFFVSRCIDNAWDILAARPTAEAIECLMIV